MEMDMQTVEIRVRGQLDPSWVEWFEGFALSNLEQGETILTGTVSDQAALYGLIGKLRDLGLTLIAVNPIGAFSQEESEERLE
jgi:hypothetical protein